MLERTMHSKFFFFSFEITKSFMTNKIFFAGGFERSVAVV